MAILEIMESFYIILESEILKDKNLNNSEKVLYGLICLYSNNEKGYCFKNNKQLAEIMNISERQYYRCINNLKELNYIIVEKTKTRCFIMPVVNQIYLEAKQRREQRQEELHNQFADILDYDWLEEEKK